LWNEIWKLQALPKIKFLLWRICNNTLLTKENLHKRNLLPDSTCQLCGKAPKTTEHLFILCDKTKHIWSNPVLQVKTSPANITHIDKWIHETLISRSDPHWKALFVGVLWQLRKAQNVQVFQGRPPNSRAPRVEATTLTLLFEK